MSSAVSRTATTFEREVAEVCVHFDVAVREARDALRRLDDGTLTASANCA